MTWIGPILFCTVGVAAIWAMLRKRCDFVLRIDNGQVRLIRGELSRSVLADVGEVCKREEITTGTIRGIRKDRRIALEFSRQIPPPNQQQFRNLWAAR